jgi:hypothetical protein
VLAARCVPSSISPFSRARASTLSFSDFAVWIIAGFGSITAVLYPARADASAMPRPMMPAPMTTTFSMVRSVMLPPWLTSDGSVRSHGI